MAITSTQRTQIVQATVAMFGGAPGGYMTELTTLFEANGSNITNFMKALATTTAFTSQTAYANFKTTTEKATSMAAAYGLTDITTVGSAGKQAYDYFAAQLTAGVSIGEIFAAANAFLSTTTDATFTATKTLLTNKAAVAEYYTVTQAGTSTTLTTLQATIANVTATTDVSTDAAKAAAITTSTTGSTFTLTTGVDSGTAFTGGAGNDTFNATATATFNALDTLDGGAGTDTLTVADNAAAVATAGRTVTNIETANLSSSGTVTADTTAWTGLTTLSAVGTGGVNVTAASTTAITASNSGANAMAIIGGGGVTTLSTGAAAVTVGQTAVANAYTSVSVTGGTTVQIANNVGAAVATTAATSAATLTSVSLNGNTGNATLVGKGITAVTAKALVTAGQTVTVTDLDTAHTLALTLNAVDDSADGAATGGTIEFIDAEATSVAVATTVAASWDATLTAAKATAVTIAADEKLQLDALTAGIATTVGISGDSDVVVSAHTLDAAAVITSTSTGAVTFTGAILAGQTYTGGAGVDTITTSTASTKAISTGAGNDVITYGGPVDTTTAGSINGGDGTDTITMTAAQAVTATGSTLFAASVSNLEVLKFSAATGAAAAINMANADGINKVSIAGATVGALAITNAAANFTLEQRALTSFASSVALASDVGTSDNVNLVYTAADGFTSTAAFTIANVENLTITTTDTDTTAQTAVIVTPITAAAATTVTITGNMGISLIGGMTQTTLTSLDASGIVGDTGAFDGLTWTAGALAASSVIKGSATGDNTIIFSAANTASTFVTYTGGTGADTVTGSNGLNNVVNLGDGTNSYTQAGAGNATVTGGTGADTISVGTGSNTVILGGGTTANSVTVGAAAGLNVITASSTGVDTIVLGGIQTAAGYYTSVTGLTAGDKIDFSGVTTVARADAAMGAKITLGAESTFANYLDAATSTTIADAGASLMSWFQLNGNTYIVVDNTSAALTPDDTNTFQDGVDSVIQLTGLVTLTTAATVSDVLTLV